MKEKIEEGEELIVGIDLGTTNSAIAVMQDGVPRVIEIDGQSTMPSCVGFDVTGDLLVGQPAVNQQMVAPERTISSVKRKMGSKERIPLGDEQFLPEEISAMILKELRKYAEKALDASVNKAVITVPAYFDENQRKATHVAAELAGLEVVRIINEPTAAALAYNTNRSDADDGQKIMVYDFGGGTFDVSIVNCQNGLVEVLASHGDTNLGGDDLDLVLYNSLVECWEGKQELDLSETSRTHRRLLVAAEALKCSLSDKPVESVREDYLTDDEHLETEILRSDFEGKIQDLLTKTLGSMGQALEQAKLSIKDIDKVLLVGGSTRVPLVQAMIETQMQMVPSREVNPDLVVAMGAAIQAAIIAGDEINSILVDIANKTYSNFALAGDLREPMCIPIIKRGTPLPVTRSELFRTNHDNQEKVVIDVYQGESSNPLENLPIGEFEVEGLSKVDAGNAILVEFSLDLNGILKVTAKERSTGLSKSVKIDTNGVESSLDLAEAQKRLSEQFGESDIVDEESESEKEIDGEVVRAKSLKKRADVLLAGDLNEDDEMEIKDLLGKILAAIKSNDLDTLKEVSDVLEDILFYLEV